MTRAAWSILWKWSVPVTRTGPDWTAVKIGNALFPGLALPISHLVTLRLAKAPITVCESAQSRRLFQPGNHFFISRSVRRALPPLRAIAEGTWEHDLTDGIFRI